MFAEARNWGPEIVGNLTFRQLKIYCMKLKGIDGVEYLGDVMNVNPRRKKDPRKKLIQPLLEKAVKNLISGKRWDSQVKD